MWSRAHELRSLTFDVFCNGREDRSSELKEKLENCKDVFLSPLKCPTKDADHRVAVQKAVQESIHLPEIDQNVSLTKDFVDEVLFLSDLFTTDELIIVELLLSAVGQLPMYPDLPRGFLAVVLYYDAHFAFVEVLRTLIQARRGRSWTPALAQASQLIATFVEDLWSLGLMKAILGCLRTFDIAAEFSRLENFRALGSAKHRYDVHRLLQGIHNGLCECILLWTCQSSLSFSEFKDLLDHLLQSGRRPPIASSENVHASNSVATTWDHSRIHLVMALLYSLEPFPMFTGVADTVEDLTNYDLSHPLFSDRRFAANVSNLFTTQKEYLETLPDDDVSDQLSFLALLRFGWAISLRSSSHLRAELHRLARIESPTTSPSTENNPHAPNDFGVDEDEESLVAIAIDSDALEFIRKCLLSVPGFEREPLWIYRIHGLITDLLVYMPGRVKDIRLKDEDLHRRTGFDPSSVGSGFANFLLILADLYDCPGSRLHARLALEYWWPAGDLAGTTGASWHTDLLWTRSPVSHSPSAVIPVGQKYRESGNFRQSSLLRFIRLAGDLAITPSLFVPYLRMLRGLVGSRSAASLCFNLLKSNANNPGRTASLFSWDHFFSSFRQYLNHMKQPVAAPVPALTATGHRIYPHLYNSRTDSASLSGQSTARTFSSTCVTGAVRAIQPEEQIGLQAVLRLIARVSRMDPVARSDFSYNVSWQAISTCTGLLTCPIPLALKAELLHLLTAFARTPSMAAVLWRHVSAPELLPIVQPRSAGQTTIAVCGLHTEMDEVEPRAEEYPITRAFLSFITAVAPHLSTTSCNSNRSNDVRESNPDENRLQQGQVLVSAISFVINAVFLKHTMRAYRDPNERWEIAASCLVLFDGLIDQFLRRLCAAAAATKNFQANSSSDEVFTRSTATISDKFGVLHHLSSANPSCDWPAVLLTALQELHFAASSNQLVARFSLPELLANLRLPLGWPHVDPGFILVRLLLWDSCLFRTLTGLLEVGLHRLLEFPLTDGPPSGMVRATAAGLRIVQRMLACEETLVAFVRRTAVEIPLSTQRPGSVRTLPLPELPSLNGLPTGLSRLLMSVNSRTGRADLLPMLLRYCCFDELPDHCTSSLEILGHAMDLIRPHGDLLSLLIADLDTRRLLLGTFSSLLKWPHASGLIETSPSTWNPVIAKLNEMTACFSDEWLLEGGATYDPAVVTTLGMSSNSLPHPVAHAARLYAAFPAMPSYWNVSSPDWELLSAWPATGSSVLNPVTLDDGSFLSSLPLCNRNVFLSGNVLFDWIVGQRPRPFVVQLLHILLAALEQPAPNLCHWLLGFRTESTQALAHSVLQDAGIDDQPRTCLHALLDLFDLGLRCGPAVACLPKQFVLTLHWTLAFGWQIIHHVATDSFTAQPLLRYLRSNYNLLMKHLQFSLGRPPVPLVVPQGPDDLALAEETTFQQVLELLSLNQASWVLRTAAVELHMMTSGNQRSYASRLLKVIFGDLISSGTAFASNPTSEINAILYAFLNRLRVAEVVAAPESFELHSLEPRLVDELISESGFACPLIASDSSAVRKLSTLIDPVTFLNRLYYKLLSTSSGLVAPDDLGNSFATVFRDQWDPRQTNEAEITTNSGSSALTMVTQDLRGLCRFMDSRNLYRLRLFVGKQAAFEAWRQLVEIASGLIVRNPTSYSMPVTSVHGSTLARSSERPSPLVCLDIMYHLLIELCQTTDSPSSIRLLASGTLLHLASYLASPDARVHYGLDSTRLARKDISFALSRATYMLVWLVLQTRASAQRMRANFYGTLCFLLRLATALNCYTTDVPDSLVPECLSSMTAASKSCLPHWSQTEFLRHTNQTELSPFHCVLVWDLLRGHAITQMVVMSLVEVLITSDRTPRELLTFVSQESVLQHIVNSIPEELSVLTMLMTSGSSLADRSFQISDDPSAIATTATTAYHMYRSKMAFLCRLASTSIGAKALIQADLVNILSNCAVYSASNLSDCYVDCLSNSGNVPAPTTGSIFTTLADALRSMPIWDSSDWSDESALHKVVNATAEATRLTSDSSVISWSGILLPTVQLFSALLITLGPFHASANQQVINFVYTHSDSLLLDDLGLGSALCQVRSQLESGTTTSMVWLLSEWIAAQTTLAQLFVLVSRNQTPINAGDEYATLQRDVVQSRILRQTLGLLSTIVPDLAVQRPPTYGKKQTILTACKAGLDYAVFETQRAQLIRHLVAVCAGSICVPDLLGPASSKSGKAQSLFPLLGQVIQNDMNQIHSCFTLFFQLASWSLDQLAALEQFIGHLAKLNLFDSTRGSRPSPSKSAPYSAQRPTSVVQMLLNYDLTNQSQLSGEQLKQIVLLLFGLQQDFTLIRTGNEQSQEVDLFQSLIPVGIAFTRLRLSALLDICDQVTYIGWRFLDFQLSPDPDPCASRTRTPQPRSIRPLWEVGLAAAAAADSASPTKHKSVASNKTGKLDKTSLAAQVQVIKDTGVLSKLEGLCKVPYLDCNRQLFLRTMHGRLERLIARSGVTPTARS